MLALHKADGSANAPARAFVRVSASRRASVLVGARMHDSDGWLWYQTAMARANPCNGLTPFAARAYGSS